MGWFWTTVVRLHTFGGPTVMLLYPLYASIRAIESPSKEDDQQWLSYWIIYSFVALLELAAAPIFAWIPLWSTIKLACACWLVLPPFNGAAYIYDVFVRGKLLQYQERMGKNLSQSQQKILHLMSPRNRRSVEHFISERGSDEFDRVIAEAFRSSNRRYED